MPSLDSPVHTIYRTDDTPGGASAIFTPDSSATAMSGLTVSGNSIYFLTTESSGSGNAVDLWKSDGTSNGTTLVASIPNAYTYGPGALIAANGKVFFTVDIGSTGSVINQVQLWSSDGTARGTSEVTSLNDELQGAVNGDLQGVAALGNNLVYTQPDSDGPGRVALDQRRHRRRHGPASRLSAAVPATSGYSGNISSLTVSGGLSTSWSRRHDFAALGDKRHRRGNRPCTTAIAGSGGVDPSDLVDMNGTLYFLANDPASGQEALWSTDGTPPAQPSSPTWADSYSYPGGAYPAGAQLVASDNTLFFLGSGSQTSSNGPDVWQSDGTAAGTTDDGNLPVTPSFDGQRCQPLLHGV